MNTKGEIFEADKAKCREFDVNQIHKYIAGSGLTRAGSWGFRNGTKMNNGCYRFQVSGFKHKGYVYIVLNGLDLFDIYYTTLASKVKKVVNDIYLEDLIEVLDKDIERISAYVR